MTTLIDSLTFLLSVINRICLPLLLVCINYFELLAFTLDSYSPRSDSRTAPFAAVAAHQGTTTYSYNTTGSSSPSSPSAHTGSTASTATHPLATVPACSSSLASQHFSRLALTLIAATEPATRHSHCSKVARTIKLPTRNRIARPFAGTLEELQLKLVRDRIVIAASRCPPTR